MRKKTFLLGALFTLALLFIFCVSAAAAPPTFKVSVYGGDDRTLPDAVRVKEINGLYSMMLPGCADRENLTVWYSGDTLSFNGVEVPSGESTDAFASDTVEVSRDGSSYTLTVLQGTGSGAVFITTESGSLAAVFKDKEHKEPGNIIIVDENGEKQYSGALEYIKGRGNSTWNNPKKPYNIKLDKKADLFGMGKSKKWCLLADYSDLSFLRNDLGFSLSRGLGNELTTECKMVSFYSNGDYLGAYTLTEKVEIGDNRVEINDLEGATEDVNEADLDTYPLAGKQDSIMRGTFKYSEIPVNPEEITGGYLLELEKNYRYANEIAGFVSPNGQCVTIKEPEYVTREQSEYIFNYYKEFEEAFASPNGYNSLGKYYTEYVDIDELAAAYILQEFCENFDGNSSSFYLYKEVGDPILHVGPAWDLDLGLGNGFLNQLITYSLNASDPTIPYIFGTFIDTRCVHMPSFLGQALNHADFADAVKTLWQTQGNALIDAMLESAAEKAAVKKPAAVMDAVYWGRYGTSDPAAIGGGYDGAAAAVTGFINARRDFMNSYLGNDSATVRYETWGKTTGITVDMTVYGEGAQAVAAEPEPARKESYVFLGWSDIPGGEPVYQPGDSFDVGSGRILYGVWQGRVLPFVPGDVTGNGKVEVDDARLALRAAILLENYDADTRNFRACNVVADDAIGVDDARIILRAAIGLENLNPQAQPTDINLLPAEEPEEPGETETTTAPSGQEETTGDVPPEEATTEGYGPEETTDYIPAEEFTTEGPGEPIIDETTSFPAAEESTTAASAEESTTGFGAEESTTGAAAEESTTGAAAEESTTGSASHDQGTDGGKSQKQAVAAPPALARRPLIPGTSFLPGVG